MNKKTCDDICQITFSDEFGKNLEKTKENAFHGVVCSSCVVRINLVDHESEETIIKSAENLKLYLSHPFQQLFEEVKDQNFQMFNWKYDSKKSEYVFANWKVNEKKNLKNILLEKQNNKCYLCFLDLEDGGVRDHDYDSITSIPEIQAKLKFRKENTEIKRDRLPDNLKNEMTIKSTRGILCMKCNVALDRQVDEKIIDSLVVYCVRSLNNQSNIKIK